MMTMNELVDLRMQQQIAHEIYRQQIMQRIPDPFPPMLPIPIPRHVIMPPRIPLPDADVTLQNNELWKQFHQIGTEMIITKCGRRMFPSMRLSLSGLEDESNYCVLLEMVPIGECRYKFSGSQWMPAGGAEPQSPQRMYLHPDSPASGAHWKAQPILFNKVKLTNNTLDSNGHIVLASMHKYQPRIHVIRTADLTQIPWAPQQVFVFPETEFVAVTAYQNDRITKLKIDNNPFAKGFRETGQSRSKRKMSSSPSDEDSSEQQQQKQLKQNNQQQQQQQVRCHQGAIPMQPIKLQQMHSHSERRAAVSPIMSTLTVTSESGSSICSDKTIHLQNYSRSNNDDGDDDDIAYVNVDIVADAVADTDDDGPQIKRLRSNESAASIPSPPLHELIADAQAHGRVDNRDDGSQLLLSLPLPLSHEETRLHQQPALLEWSQQLPEQTAGIAFANGGHSSASSSPIASASASPFMQNLQQNMQSMLRPSLVDLACTYFGRSSQPIYARHVFYQPHTVAGDQNQLSAAMPPTAERFPHLEFGESALPPTTPLTPAMPTRANEIFPPLSLYRHNHQPHVGGEESLTRMVDNIDEEDGQQDFDSQQKQQSPNITQTLQLEGTRSHSPPKRKGFSISAILGGGS